MVTIYNKKGIQYCMICDTSQLILDAKSHNVYRKTRRTHPLQGIKCLRFLCGENFMRSIFLCVMRVVFVSIHLILLFYNIGILFMNYVFYILYDLDILYIIHIIHMYDV